jgi:methylenetetrahydrofolate dehydrogenase (NADP+)/methenyltetrahydrofolate cyclohydrolase
VCAAEIIDGKALAAELRRRVGEEVARLSKEHHVAPGLAVVLVGDNPASQVYVRSKSEHAEEAGIHSFVHRLPAEIREGDLLTLIAGLDMDYRVNGILVQLPLPSHIRADKVLEAIRPEKDVDGFHVVNAGRLALGVPDVMVPCTPQGCLMLIRSRIADLSGRRAVIVGRSNIVGKPMAQLLLAADCTVTITHSKTRDLAEECRRADILVAAVGRPGMVRGDWIKPGAVVIDVGINRIEAADGKTRLVGDVAYEEAREVAGAITPVPGGVGPMTVACLLRNALIACCRQHRFEIPEI